MAHRSRTWGAATAVLVALASTLIGIAPVGTTPAAQAAEPGMLRVTTSPPVAAQIIVDGVRRDRWGLNWMKIAAGSHTVCFGDVPGAATPPCQNVTVTSGATTTVNGAFTALATIRVVTSPAVAATIWVDEVALDDWGVFTDITPGMHTVCFDDAVGWAAPGCQKLGFADGTTTTVTGTYTAWAAATPVPGLGMLRVTTSPAVPSLITVDGEPRDRWGLDWMKIAPGSHTVCYSDVAGFLTPSCQTATVTAGATTTLTGTFTENGYLRVITAPPVPSTITIDGIPRNDWGVYTDFAPGSHHICFGAVPGRITPQCIDQTLTAGATKSPVVTFVPTTGTPATVSAGDAHTCALRPDHTVACWGWNNSGQLGNGTTNQSATPVTVSGITNATAIAAGGTSTCAIRGAGTVSCWGANGRGQLGNNTTNGSTTPVTVSGITNATRIAVGTDSACAVRADGTVACWGNNSHGQLGNGTTTDSHVPVTVYPLVDAVGVSVGTESACATRSGGTVACWGRNNHGQLGDGTTTGSSFPVVVSGLTTAQTVGVGAAFACAERAGGSVVCWGVNDTGQLGIGTSLTTQSTTPLLVQNITDAAGIDVGHSHACVVTIGSGVTCWGANDHHQASYVGSVLWQPSIVSNITGVVGVGAGGIHTCAAKANGKVAC